MSTRYLGGFITKSPTAPTTSAAPGIWTLDQALGYIKAGTWPVYVEPNSQSFTTVGTFTWIAPVNVTRVSVVAVGGGSAGLGGQYGNGGSGGGLRYINNYTVVPGSSYTVVVGAGGVSGAQVGSDSYFNSSGTVRGGGASFGSGGTGAGDGGGNGGSTNGGAGGAGGYSGNGGNGGASANGSSGSGGGGGGGGNIQNCCGGWAGAGGGVGLFGQGANGSGGAGGGGFGTAGGGGGGSGGAAGGNSTQCVAGTGGLHGGGGGASGGAGAAGRGAVRIVWPGTTRSFPSTCVGAP